MSGNLIMLCWMLLLLAAAFALGRSKSDSSSFTVREKPKGPWPSGAPKGQGGQR